MDNDENDDVYYRLIRRYDHPEWITVVCMQYFDEDDYDKSMFLRAKGTDDILYFSTQEGAIQYLSDNIKPEHIDPDFRFSLQSVNDSLYKD